MDGGLLLVLCVLSFILGFLSVALYVSWQQAYHVRKVWTESSSQWTQVGCHKVLAPSVEPRPLQFNSQLTGVKSIDEELEKLLSLGLRDLFESWYHTHVSPDPVCSQEGLELAHNVIQEVAAAGREVDYLAFFIETLINDFMDHLRAYKVACGTASVGVVTGQSAAIWNEAVETEFFKCESGEDPWRAVWCDREARIAYLYRLSELLLCIVLPEDEFSSPSLQALLTDVLVWKVWTPLLKTLALPDNINATFISMCKESSLNTDSFMAALSEGANETEVRSLRYNVNSHTCRRPESQKSALESVLATAKAVLSAKSVPANVSSDSLIALSAAIPDYDILNEGTTKHCVFHVNVSCKHSHVSVTEKWIIDRRYRDFHDLHLSLRAQIDNFPVNLVLPTLPSFHKLDPQRLDVRRIQLEGYLKTIISEEFLSDHLHVLGQVILFLSEGEYERQSTELKRMANTLLNPLKRVATLTRGALKSSGQSSSKMSPVTVKKQPSSETPKPPGEESFGASKPAAKKHFEFLYQDKTGNSWGTSKESFVKRPSKFYPLEIDYGGDEDTGQQLGIAPGSKSTLAPEIQDLIRMIFDVESMKKAMLEFEIDIKKMPLGKLSRRQIESAYSVLSELQREIVGTQNPSKILDYTNKFYTLVPHDFGMTKPPPLNSEEVIKIKTQMLDNLLEIEVAYSLLKQEDGVSGGKDPLDLHYEQLKTKMDVLPKSSDEFSMLQEYVSNTHAVTHSQYSLEVLEVFKVDREGEGKKYKPFSKLHNRQLLWHGSRKTNFVGILSQGLRIAPPEAPVTGYMFGKGVYFADMVSKSANYCNTSRSDNEGLMLLCEVALGDMCELTHSKYVDKLPAGKHSTKGLGRTAPTTDGHKTTEEGVVIPMGKGSSTAVDNTSLLYNEYPIQCSLYDVSQIRIKCLLKMNFKYKW
ncbi:uncharacterized protein LOC135348405 isoform X3 [Halichondria panicea]|uniref:uncharacterized protein LOC135348405 isoform X3 n=1 Tax=Halichondria panicea TaxID=6063 RepID=UPI00312B8347